MEWWGPRGPCLPHIHYIIMAWDSGVTVNDRVVYSETVTLANATQAYSSEITFVKPRRPFAVVINTGATNTTGAVVTDLEGSYDGSTYADIDGSFAADCDTATLISAHDASAGKDFPYYRLEFDCAADDSSTTITVKVVTTA